MKKSKPARGRPSTYSRLPPLIPDTPENIAKAILSGPPKQEWDYLKPKGKAK